MLEDDVKKNVYDDYEKDWEEQKCYKDDENKVYGDSPNSRGSVLLCADEKSHNSALIERIIHISPKKRIMAHNFRKF